MQKKSDTTRITQHVGLYVQADEMHLVHEGTEQMQGATVAMGRRLHDPKMMEGRMRYARWVKRKNVDAGKSVASVYE